MREFGLFGRQRGSEVGNRLPLPPMMARLNLVDEGKVARHLKRARRHYHQRRDLACQVLRAELAAWLTFTVPAGGLAIWAQFHPAVELPRLVAHCQQLGLAMSGGTWYGVGRAADSSLRLGFVSLIPAKWAKQALSPPHEG